MQELITRAEFLRITGISKNYLAKLVANGDVARKVLLRGGRKGHYLRSDAERLVSTTSRPVNPP
jgi:hypothetical protein